MKIFVPVLILRALSRGLNRLKSNSSKGHLIRFFTGLIWFFPQTFSILANNVIISSGKSKLKFSESSWTELILYGVFYSNSNKLNKYFDFIGNRYFIGSILILIFILAIL
jgi:hypothetical protein